MTGLERRQTPRTTMERHAYINIEPENGGIVLNVSDGGLCFHSLDPVQRNGTIRFWFSDHNQRIEANGAVAWTDETQKGGLRFTALPAEAREQIRDWISQPTPFPADERLAPAGPPRRVFPTLSSSRLDAKPAPVGSAPLAGVAPELTAARPLSGFSRGLATGLLVSVFVMTVFLFNSYRREIGESLIQLGERFAAKPQAQSLTVSAATLAVLPATSAVLPAPPPVSPAPQIVPPAPQAVLRAPAPVLVPRPEKVLPQPEKLVPQPLASPAKPQQAKLEQVAPATAMPTAAGYPAPKVPATAAAPPVVLTAPAITLPTTAVAPNVIPGKLVADQKLAPTDRPGVRTEDSTAKNADSTLETYFEVGRFKNELQAHEETDKLAQLGFPATAVQKGYLWTSFYHVLVGPYDDEHEAKVTHKNLVSSGFKPRPVERGSRDLSLRSSLTLNGAPTPEGDYIVSWESYVADASVKFMRNNYVVAAADGRWVRHGVKYQRNEYVYRRNADGSRTLLEIHFGGMRQALVFGKPS